MIYLLFISIYIYTLPKVGRVYSKSYIFCLNYVYKSFISFLAWYFQFVHSMLKTTMSKGIHLL